MQVAERSLFLWNNDYIVTLVAQHRQVILPVVFNALESNARSHWNPAVHGLTSNVKKVFQDMDMVLWRECEAQYQQEEVSHITLHSHWVAQQCNKTCVPCCLALPVLSGSAHIWLSWLKSLLSLLKQVVTD